MFKNTYVNIVNDNHFIYYENLNEHKAILVTFFFKLRFKFKLSFIKNSKLGTHVKSKLILIIIVHFFLYIVLFHFML